MKRVVFRIIWQKQMNYFSMEEFTIYKGTPEGKDLKIGVDSKYPRRIKKQRIQDAEILEVHTDIYEVSRREQELQRLHGVKVDKVPYYVTHNTHSGKITSEETKRKMSKPRTEEAKRRMSEAQTGSKKSEETKRKIGESLKGKKRGPYKSRSK